MFCLNKYKFLLGTKAVKGPLYLKVMLEKIQTVRKIFALEIELGEEVYIPKELTLKECPLNF